VLVGKGFLNEHTLNYEYQQLDNVAIFYNYRQKKLKNEYQFQFPFTSEFSSIVTQNTVTISKKCSIFKEKKYL